MAAVIVGLAQSACTTAVQPPQDTGGTPAVDPGSTNGGGGGVQCDAQINISNEADFNFDLFRRNIVPLVASTNCTGCHNVNGGGNAANFKAWPNATTDACDQVKQFNELFAKNLIDLSQSAEDNRLYTVLVDTDVTGHPRAGGIPFLASDERAVGTLAFISDAISAYEIRTGANNNDANDSPVETSPLNFNVYASSINRLFDSSDGGVACSSGGCHSVGSPAPAGGFGLHTNAAVNSQQMQDNFKVVEARVNLQNPESSRMYVNANPNIEDTHNSARPLSSAEADTLLNWIRDAGGVAQPNPGNTGCPDVNLFNERVFATDILPVLFGEIDANDLINGPRGNQGCSSQVCHGNESRAGGALILSKNRTPQQNLASFACFVDPANPPASNILLCATNSAGCRGGAHPGQEPFDNVQDENYNRVLNFILAAINARTPLDYGFYSANIDPIYSSRAVIENGAIETCDNAGCHGVNGLGDEAPGGSDFPIFIASANNQQSRDANFATSSNFANFINPQAASLFLYPTNEIANLDNAAATGLAHPGGEVFAVDSVSGQNILRWAGGLRAELVDGSNEAAVIDWLVVGEFAASEIDDLALFNEEDIRPQFEEATSGQDNGGEWDVVSGQVGQAAVDLDGFFGGVQNSRIVYAAAYLVNISDSPVEGVELTVRTASDVKIFAEDRFLVSAEQQGGNIEQVVTGNIGTVPPFSENGETVRVLLKLFQDVNETPNLNFQAVLQDGNDQPLDLNDGRIVIKLGREPDDDN